MLKLDRMFRNATDCLSTIEKLDKAGIALHVVDLGGNAIDTTSAAGRFMLVVLAGAAEMERNLTRERTRSAMAIKPANSERVGAVLEDEMSHAIVDQLIPPYYAVVFTSKQRIGAESGYDEMAARMFALV